MGRDVRLKILQLPVAWLKSGKGGRPLTRSSFVRGRFSPLIFVSASRDTCIHGVEVAGTALLLNT
jgi:hypothetical protein